MIRRFGLLVLIFAFSAASALACNEPSLGSVTPSAGAGEPVSFSAVHLDQGAAYTLVLEGRTVASGTAAGDAIDGTFAMPDLGSAGAYYLELDVAHEGGTWISSRPIQFVVPAAAAPAPAAKPRAAAPPQEKLQPAATTKFKPTVAPKAIPAAPPAERASATSTAIPRHAVQGAKADGPRGARARPGAASTKSAPLVRAPHDLPLVVAGLAAAARTSVRAAAREDDDRLVLWLGLAAGGLLAAGLVARARRARRDAAIEAELQEMIAEARAAEGAGLRSRF